MALVDKGQPLDNILSTAEFLPHDATVSAAMLIIATLNLTLGLHPPSPHDLMCASQKILVSKFQGYCTSCSPFSQLSLCHALLAKLPLSVMVVLEMEGQPLLVALFQLVTKLSSRYLCVCNICSLCFKSDSDVSRVTVMSQEYSDVK